MKNPHKTSLFIALLLAFTGQSLAKASDESALCALTLSVKPVGIFVEQIPSSDLPLPQVSMERHYAFRIHGPEVFILRFIDQTHAQVRASTLSKRKLIVSESLWGFVGLGLATSLVANRNIGHPQLLAAIAAGTLAGVLMVKEITFERRNARRHRDLADGLQELISKRDDNLPRVVSSWGTLNRQQMPQGGSFLFPQLVNDLQRMTDNTLSPVLIRWSLIVAKNPHSLTDGGPAEPRHYYLSAQVDYKY